MTMYVIRCWGFANGQDCPHEGQYLESFDHEAYDGLGYGEFTPDIAKAHKFTSHQDVMEFYLRVPEAKKVRPDGQPNRPLTSMHAELLPDTMW